MTAEPLVFNGISARGGGYLVEPLTIEQLARVARGETLAPDEIAELRARNPRRRTRSFGVREGVDPKDLGDSGWAAIFPHVKPGTEEATRQAAIIEALEPLLALRRRQATTRDERRYKLLTGPAAYRPGESKGRFLGRQGVGPGPADPDKLPYYLLLVASPEELPYRVQYQLDVQYSVGRLHFDSIEEYANYAQSVVAAEEGGLALPRRATFFGVSNPDDKATHASAEDLVRPLADYLDGDQQAHGWTIEREIGAGAQKARLAQLLGGTDTPALLFSASHGVGFESGDPLQLAHQGALLCQDWPGPVAWHGDIPRDFYFSGEDLGSDARLHGLMAFFFACFGAGSPRLDDYAKATGASERGEIAPHAFVANLPQRMLGHPRGGALAVVGHVERAWGSSFSWRDVRGVQGSEGQRTHFESTLKRLCEGHPVGSALEFFDARYAEVASDLTELIEDLEFNPQGRDDELVYLWTANNDARGYAIIGDPAVRLPVAEATGSAVRQRHGLDLGASRPPMATMALASPEAAAGDAEAGTLSRVADGLAGHVRGLLDPERVVEITTSTVEPARRTRGGTGSDVTELKAKTRIRFDGSMEHELATDAEGGVSPEVLRFHADMVRLAQESRRELLEKILPVAARSEEDGDGQA